MPGLFIAGALLSACMASAGGGGTARPGEGGVGACPPEYPNTREMALALLDAPAFAEDAAALGLSSADTLGLRLLTAPADSAACRQLHEVVARGNMDRALFLNSFFQVRDYYLIETAIHPDSGTRINPDGTLNIRIHRAYNAVLDSTFTVIAVFGV